jgi:1,4-dihydroxy-6-naphthoate synthase
MKITVAHSPDSDDAFMHYGISSGSVPTDGIEIQHLLCDIETLNRAAFDGKYEVSAVSFHAYAHLTDKYLLLPHGSSMGDKYGPMVVKRRGGPSTLKGVKVAVPGTLTTAFLALKLYDPDVQHVVMPFDTILEAVRDGEVDAGLLIHEGQLTYRDEGLDSIVELGEWWSDRTGGLPLPLGGNVIRRDLGPTMIAKISKMLHDSIAYALGHRQEALDYALQYGRGLDRAKADTFVGMYVNELTLDYGDRGRAAVQRLMDEAWAKRLIPKAVTVEFSN